MAYTQLAGRTDDDASLEQALTELQFGLEAGNLANWAPSDRR